MTEQSEDERHSNEKKSNDKRTDSHMMGVRPGTAA
jgi:hypothetical protein